MTEPGWYPVPDDPEERRRYWDGNEWGAYWDEDAEASKTSIQIEPNFAALGLAVVAGVLAIIAVFLPQLESTTFARIQENSMIQNGDGWLILLGAVGVLAGAYRAYAGKTRTWTTFVFGVLVLGLAIYDGTGSRTELTSAVSGFGELTDKASPGIGIYAAGAAGFLAMLAGLNLARGGTLLAATDVERKTKICPDCAETVLSAARVCKHCGHQFAPATTTP